MKQSLSSKLLREFSEITGFEVELSEEYCAEFKTLCEFLEARPLRDKEERRRWLIARLNWKFRLNQEPIAQVYSSAAKEDITFNYHEKNNIQLAFDLNDEALYRETLL